MMSPNPNCLCTERIRRGHRRRAVQRSQVNTETLALSPLPLHAPFLQSERLCHIWYTPPLTTAVYANLWARRLSIHLSTTQLIQFSATVGSPIPALHAFRRILILLFTSTSVSEVTVTILKHDRVSHFRPLSPSELGLPHPLVR